MVTIIIQSRSSLKPGEKMYHCNSCYKSYTTKYSFKFHQCQNSTECNRCKEDFKSVDDLRIHKKTGKCREPTRSEKNSLRKCEECGFETTKARSYLHHLYKEHNFNAQYCDLCGRKFPNSSKLQDHMETNHLKKYDYACEVCDIKFYAKKNLYTHNRKHHQPQKHICTYCEKGFVNNYLLKDHINVHTKLKPYKCGNCETGFQNKSNMIAHQRKSCKKLTAEV